MENRRAFCRTAALSTGALLGGGLLAEAASAAPVSGSPASGGPASGLPWAAARKGVGATLVREKWLNSRVVDLTVHSRVMGRQLKVRLVVPKGWSRKATRTWPSIWALHGGNADYTAWSKHTDITTWATRSRVLVVMPEGGPAGGYTDWWNFGLGGQPAWETFHLHELRPLLERSYRAGPRRAVIGQSAGGYGAMAYASRHPGMFRAAASYSGVLSILTPGAPEVMMNGIGPFINPNAMWGHPVLQRNIWKAHDPYNQAHRLRGTRLYVSCAKRGVKGPLDPPNGQFADPAEAFCLYATKPFLNRLKALRIPVTTHLYEKGTHSWWYWEAELHRSWPMLIRALRA